MAIVKLNNGQNEASSFEIFDEDGKAGEMIFAINESDLTVYHTEVEQEKEGMGYAKMLLDSMVDYVRKNKPYGHSDVSLCTPAISQT